MNYHIFDENIMIYDLTLFPSISLVLSFFFFLRAVWMNVPGLIVIVTLCCLDGLVIFAVYSGCDLIKSGKITSNDQVKIP